MDYTGGKRYKQKNFQDESCHLLQTDSDKLGNDVTKRFVRFAVTTNNLQLSPHLAKLADWPIQNDVMPTFRYTSAVSNKPAVSGLQSEIST